MFGRPNPCRPPDLLEGRHCLGGGRGNRGHGNGGHLRHGRAFGVRCYGRLNRARLCKRRMQCQNRQSVQHRRALGASGQIGSLALRRWIGRRRATQPGGARLGDGGAGLRPVGWAAGPARLCRNRLLRASLGRWTIRHPFRRRHRPDPHGFVTAGDRGHARRGDLGRRRNSPRQRRGLRVGPSALRLTYNLRLLHHRSLRQGGWPGPPVYFPFGHVGPLVAQGPRNRRANPIPPCRSRSTRRRHARKRCYNSRKGPRHNLAPPTPHVGPADDNAGLTDQRRHQGPVKGGHFNDGGLRRCRQRAFRQPHFGPGPKGWRHRSRCLVKVRRIARWRQDVRARSDGGASANCGTPC